ncbi:tetratricopeptide repeat-containing S1 family peptidase [Leptolyngbya sp. NIES-2104]|uniref:tetratricopeptide repeat-containing S1 family peptidase n=1 Tax=Leptolyngbya sp. NIES-2104 TaxID=1552121 RepID=UPI0006EC8DB9|nr:tetratricopeptide repeat-containing serine protease family protein [Leptolyngbya sp. NIES-2104]GAP96968.1 hypothetical protein NIES2104_35150 [Leptolyngbya sp. NIES-2104]
MRFDLSPILVTTTSIAALIITIPSTSWAKSAQEVAKLAVPVTVQINTPLLPGGTGVIVGRQGNLYTVLTANHVVKRQDLPYTIRTSTGKDYTVGRVQSLQSSATDPDLAVVTFETAGSYPVATLGDSDQAGMGADIYVAGFPISGDRTGSDRDFEFTRGSVTSRPSARPQGYTLRYNATTRVGMSGGPVLDVEGRVVGIHGQGDIEGSLQTETGVNVGLKTGFNSAIPTNTFLALKSRLNVSDTQIAIDKTPTESKPAQINSPQTAKDYYVRGLTQSDGRDSQAAIESYSQAVKLDPTNADVYYQRGLSHYKQVHYQDALNDFSEAIRLNGQFADAYYQRATVRFYLKDAQGAIEDFTASLRLNPDDVYAHMNRGIIRRSLKDAKGTLEDFDQVMRLAPSSRAFFNRALARAMNSDRTGTVEDFTEAIKLEPTFTEAYINRALARRRLGDREGAIADLTKVIEMKPESGVAYYNRGLFRRDSGDRSGAAEDLKTAIDLFKQQSDTLNYQKATEVLQRLQ